MPLRPLLVLGTRAEAIKMAPIAQACARRKAAVAPWICTTGQHRELVAEALDHFQLRADFDLAVMEPNQDLARLTARLIERLDRVIADLNPDYVVAVGDTTSVLAATICSFYRRVKFVHVEAGLRTDDLDAPWPEEFNRRVATIGAALHCAATPAAAARLAREGVSPADILVTGNTSIDALRWTLKQSASDGWGRAAARPRSAATRNSSVDAERMVLVTCHRRESFGPTLAGIVAAVAELAETFPDTLFCWPVHPNPSVRAATAPLAALANVELLPPAPYAGFVDLMRRATLILTDSGGVQEEAPTLGTPCLVLRDTTERPEAIASGANELVGTSPETIVARASALLQRRATKKKSGANPYGDGRAAERIVDWMLSLAAGITNQNALPPSREPRGRSKSSAGSEPLRQSRGRAAA